MPDAAQIVQAALAAATVTDAAYVQDLLAEALGARHQRPLGDKWNNHGLMSTSGSFDLKLIENVTNMQDAVLERYALVRHGASDKVPYRSPHEAADALLVGLDERERGRLATVTFRESNPPTGTTKRLTPVFRDAGCGLRPKAVPRTLFGLGGSHKEDALYLQGAFGLGGAMTFRNAKAVVLVSRRHPDLLLAGEEDVITAAVVQWQDNVKGATAYYLVDAPWRDPGDPGAPWSCPAAAVPDFGPGTHLALVSYRVDGFHRKREADERSFETVTNTRLYRPVLPVRFTNLLARGEQRSPTLRGLADRLERGDRDFNEGEELLPFHHGGTTYQLPVRYVLFAKRGEAGERRNYVAHDHAVLFTSNGQVHHRWTPQEFKTKTNLNKLSDRILVVVETDALPIRLRTSLFTADRSELVRGDAALRLEEELRGFLEGWDALRDENTALIREALRGDNDQPTLDIARRIGRALDVRGFKLSGGAGGGGGGAGPGVGRGGGGGGKPVKPVPQHADPTRIDGPVTVRAVIGRTRSITYTVDVVDSFWDGRGRLQVSSDHPQIRPEQEITVGKGRKGRVRVMIAVPDVAEPGIHELRVVLDGWLKASGGVGPTLEHTTKVEFVNTIPGQGSGGGKPTDGAGSGAGGPSQGNNVALRWSRPEAQEDWERITVGEVIDTPAHVLAERKEYAELAALGETPIPTVVLNEEYPPLKRYLESRSKKLETLESPRERYAVGAGVALLLLKRDTDKLAAKNEPVNPDFVAAAQESAARSVLAVMPAFDELAREAGLDGEPTGGEG